MGSRRRSQRWGFEMKYNLVLQVNQIEEFAKTFNIVNDVVVGKDLPSAGEIKSGTRFHAKLGCFMPPPFHGGRAVFDEQYVYGVFQGRPYYIRILQKSNDVDALYSSGTTTGVIFLPDETAQKYALVANEPICLNYDKIQKCNFSALMECKWHKGGRVLLQTPTFEFALEMIGNCEYQVNGVIAK